MNYNQLFKFCLIAKEQDLIKYLIISSCIFRYETTDWLQYKISEVHMIKYKEMIEELIQQYKL
jgi:hypothetical protein